MSLKHQIQAQDFHVLALRVRFTVVAMYYRYSLLKPFWTKDMRFIGGQSLLLYHDL